MNKPDWKDTPEWANYFAQDLNGEWWCYEFKPKQVNMESWKRWIPSKGQYEKCYAPNDSWKNTLEKRPS